MTEQVNRLVGNVLAGGGELFLPGVGSLYTERQGAKRLSRQSVLPPCRRLAFASQQRGASLVDEIARVLAQAASAKGAGSPCGPACDCPDDASLEQFRAQAQDIYDRWLGRTLIDGVLTVSGVGVLKFKNFTTEEAFDRRLNPHGHEPVRIKHVRRFDWALFAGGLALLVAAVIGGYEFLLFYDDSPAPAVVTERSDDGQPVADDGAWIDRALAGDRAAGAENTRAGSSMETAQVQETADKLLGAPKGEATGTENTAENSGASSARSGSDASASTGRLRFEAVGTAEAPARLVSGRRYVVLGVFSTPENAGRAVQAAAAKDSSLVYNIYRFGEKFMVSPFDAEDAEACRRFIREQSGRFPGMWTYTAR